MQVTGIYQLALLVRHNDKIVKEEYIKNGGKEVKSSTHYKLNSLKKIIKFEEDFMCVN